MDLGCREFEMQLENLRSSHHASVVCGLVCHTAHINVANSESIFSFNFKITIINFEPSK